MSPVTRLVKMECNIMLMKLCRTLWVVLGSGIVRITDVSCRCVFWFKYGGPPHQACQDGMDLYIHEAMLHPLGGGGCPAFSWKKKKLVNLKQALSWGTWSDGLVILM